MSEQKYNTNVTHVITITQSSGQVDRDESFVDHILGLLQNHFGKNSIQHDRLFGDLPQIALRTAHDYEPLKILLNHLLIEHYRNSNIIYKLSDINQIRIYGNEFVYPPKLVIEGYTS